MVILCMACQAVQGFTSQLLSKLKGASILKPGERGRHFMHCNWFALLVCKQLEKDQHSPVLKLVPRVGTNQSSVQFCFQLTKGYFGEYQL